MYQSIPKLPIPPGKPKHNTSSKGDLIEPYKRNTSTERWDPQKPMMTKEASFCPFNGMEFLYVFLERASKAQRF